MILIDITMENLLVSDNSRNDLLLIDSIIRLQLTLGLRNIYITLLYEFDDGDKFPTHRYVRLFIPYIIMHRSSHIGIALSRQG